MYNNGKCKPDFKTFMAITQEKFKVNSCDPWVGSKKEHAINRVVQVFSDNLVAFLYFDICHYLVANIKIWKSHLKIREGSDYK